MGFFLTGYPCIVVSLKAVSWDRSCSTYSSMTWTFSFKSPPCDSMLMALLPVHQILTLQLWSCLLIKICISCHPGCLQIVCQSTARKPKLWFWETLDKSLFFILLIFLLIVGVHIDNKLSFKDHISAVSTKVYAKVGALRRLKTLVPADVALMLYKA